MIPADAFEPVHPNRLADSYRGASSNHCYECGGCCSILAPNQADIHELHYRMNNVTSSRPRGVRGRNAEFDQQARLCGPVDSRK